MATKYVVSHKIDGELFEAESYHSTGAALRSLLDLICRQKNVYVPDPLPPPAYKPAWQVWKRESPLVRFARRVENVERQEAYERAQVYKQQLEERNAVPEVNNLDARTNRERVIGPSIRRDREGVQAEEDGVRRQGL